LRLSPQSALIGYEWRGFARRRWCGALDSLIECSFVLYRCDEKDNTEIGCSNEEEIQCRH